MAIKYVWKGGFWWGFVSMGAFGYGWLTPGGSCPWGIVSMGLLSVGNCLKGALVRGGLFPWGLLSMIDCLQGRNRTIHPGTRVPGWIVSYIPVFRATQHLPSLSSCLTHVSPVTPAELDTFSQPLVVISLLCQNGHL